LILVLHGKIEIEVFGLGENPAKHQHQDDGECQGEEHHRLFPVESLQANDHVGSDHAHVHFRGPPLTSSPSRRFLPVSWRKTSSRLGLRTSMRGGATPASCRAVRIRRTSSLLCTRTLTL